MRKGLDLSEQYFYDCGLPMIREKFGMLEGKFAAGLVGHGSECFSFDDAVSMDHDYGPSFCLWLGEAEYALYGDALQAAYDRLPKEYGGAPARSTSENGTGRVGVFSIPDFYYSLIGRTDAPERPMEWMPLAEERLALSVNGKVFCDESGKFTAVRERLAAFYPEDVRIKKIAARAAVMSQSGQYNYARAMKRGDLVAAHLALSEFIKSTGSMVYLLNKQYMPYYKWMHRGLAALPKLNRIGEALRLLVELPYALGAWSGTTSSGLLNTINTADERVIIMEGICGMVLEELIRQGLTDGNDVFLQSHLTTLMNHISDPAIRALQVMEG